ncbi:MAG TPA: hypothetical protein VHU40_18730 [Polyangia bacterium]|nr:hypothetical protein [Polyangia bacterium]
MSMNVEIEEESSTAGQALIAAQATASELATRLRQGVAGDATFTPCGTKVMTVGARANAAQPAETFHITVSGRIEVPLAPELDYWKRSALIAALAELADKYAAARAPNAEHGVKLNGLRAGVKNAESHRGKLTELWVQRARAFAVAAQAQEAPLFLLDCAPPGDIVQKEKSLEEIGLSLSESCRLNSLKAASGAR